VNVLFSPIAVKHLTFNNRIVLPPMVCSVMPEMADYAAVDGIVSEPSLQHYGQRAEAGTGFIIVEATAVDEGGRCWRGGLGAYADAHLPSLKRLAGRVHAGDAVAGIQLVHGGPQGLPEMTPAGLVGPSQVKSTGSTPGVRALTVEEIEEIEQRFAEAAARAVDAGFDVIELHAAHGFLLDSFLMVERNQRTDAYGGNLAGRMRMLLETCHRVKQRIGDHALLDCRISFFNKQESEFTSTDLEYLIRGLEEAEVDLLHISTDGAFRGYFGTTRTIGHWVKGLTDLPIIVAGALGDPRDAERAVAEHHADFAAVGSAMLHDPYWTRCAAEKLGAQA